MKKLILLSFVMVLLSVNVFAGILDDCEVMLYYRFDSNTLNEGNMTNADLTGTFEGFVSGIIGNAIDLERGSSQRVKNITLDGDDTAKARSIVFDIKPESVDQTMTLLNLELSSAIYLQYHHSAGNQIQINTNGFGGDWTVDSGASTTSAGTWMQLALSWGSNGVKLFVDGDTTPKDTHASTAVLPNTFDKILVGVHPNDADVYFDGLIDNLAVLDCELTTAYVTEVYNSGDRFDFNPAAPEAPNVELKQYTSTVSFNDTHITYNRTLIGINFEAQQEDLDFPTLSGWTLVSGGDPMGIPTLSSNITVYQNTSLRGLDDAWLNLSYVNATASTLFIISNEYKTILPVDPPFKKCIFKTSRTLDGQTLSCDILRVQDNSILTLINTNIFYTQQISLGFGSKIKGKGSKLNKRE